MRVRTSRVTATALVVAVATACGVSDEPVFRHLEDTYEPVSGEIAGAYDDSYAWRSPEPVAVTADDIAAAVPPVDRVSEADQAFLAYEDVVVAVTPAEGGSIVHLDDEERGYRRWYGFIGPIWAPYYGPGGTFRGGGPGSGK